MAFYKNIETGQSFYFDTVEERPGFIEVTEEEVTEAANTAAGPVVPAAVTMRQFRLGLLAQGQLGEIDRAVKRDDTPEGKALQIEWAFRESVDRESELVGTFCGLASMSDAEIDSVFITGAAL